MITLRSLFNSKVTKNSMWIIGEQIFQMFLSLVIGVLSARYLGPSNYGALNYTGSFVTFCTSIVTLGMDGVVIKKMISKPSEEGHLLGGCILLRVLTAFLSSIAIIFIVWVLNPSDDMKLTLILIQSLQLIFMAVNILDNWFQRWLKSKYVSIAKMVASIAVSCYKIYLLATAKDIRWFAFSNVLSYLVISVMLYVAYKRYCNHPLKFDVKSGISVLSESYHFIISGVMVAMYSQMDKIMLGAMIDDTAVGLYTTASTLCTTWLFVPMAIINSFRPKIMETKQSGNEKLFLIRLEQLYSLIIWLCLLVSALVCLLGYWAIDVLYGKGFIGAIIPLRILIWSELFSMIGTARGIWILCMEKQKYVKYYLGMGATLNLILNFTLIPIMGIAGAASANLMTQIFNSIIAPMCFKETRVHTKIVFESLIFKWRNNKE